MNREMLPDDHHQDRCTIVVIADRPEMRQALRERLGDEPDLEVAGEAADEAGALALVTACAPSVALIGLDLPHQRGLQLTHRLRQLCPACAVIVLSLSAGMDMQALAHTSGAAACLDIHGTDAGVLLATIRQVAGPTHQLSAVAPWRYAD
jgi:DNA-binding NarL/FixJ family response regulator